jgi:methylated-DNA-protein-cysteine methyltransferase-like protein
MARRTAQSTPTISQSRTGSSASEIRDAAFRRSIRSIPKGRVTTYGQVAVAAGYPGLSRAVARLLKAAPTGSLPWQRVVGAGGEIKLRMEAAAEQRFRLEMEGVRFSGRKVNMREYGHKFPKRSRA